MIEISACIVLYRNKRTILSRTINSFLATKNDVRLFLIDNSEKNDLKDICSDSRVNYIHNPSNPGFGAAHNIAIKKAIVSGVKYHFIINPDIYFTDDVICKMVEYAEKDSRIGMMMPQILNLDSSIQNLPKLLPSPWSIVWRKIKKPALAYQRFINKYELRFVPKNMIYNAPILSGCFTLLNLEAIKKVGFYDDKFFMYFEDWDLSRRMHQHYKTIYFPEVSVYHGYESGANRNSRLFKIFINSAVTYFNKWGWFFDKDRKNINKEALSQFG
jgi:GT2 family glycosyltransferase